MWFVHYKTKGAAALHTVSTLPLAIKFACELLDHGTEVSEIEASGGLKGMNAGEIRLAWSERTERKAKKALHLLVDRPSI
jgi:hypothetical protein